MSKHINHDTNEHNPVFGEQPHKNNHDKAKQHSHFSMPDADIDEDGRDRHKYNRSKNKKIIRTIKTIYHRTTEH